MTHASSVLTQGCAPVLGLYALSRREESRKALAVFGDPIVVSFSEGQPVPIKVFRSHRIQILDSLITACTVNRPHILLGEHRFIACALKPARLQSFDHLVKLFQLHPSKGNANKLTAFSYWASFLRVPSLSANMFSKLAISSFSRSISAVDMFVRS